MIQVLLVDDEPPLLEITKIFLERVPWISVTPCGSAQEAFQELGNQDYDVIVSDYEMPGMDGIGFLKTLRKAGNSLPFIIFTGRSREKVVIEALNSGADFYIQKGGDPGSQFAELTHKIRQAVEKRQFEEDLRYSERHISDIFRHLPDATFAIDCEGRVIAWNRAMEEMTGLMAGEVMGRGEHAYAVPFFGERRPVLIDYLLESENEIPQIYSIERRDRDLIIAEIRGAAIRNSHPVLWIKVTPLYDCEGSITGAIETVRDITQKTEAENALRIANEYNRSLIEAHIDPLVTIDPGRRISDVNEAMETLTGCSREELIGTDFCDCFVDAESAREGFRQTIEQGSVKEHPLRIRQKDGSTRPVIFYASVYLGDSGEIRGVFAEVHDPVPSGQEIIDERYRHIFENSADGLFIIEDSIIDCNAEACHLLGYKREEIIGRRPADLAPESQYDGRSSAEVADAAIASAGLGTPQFLLWQFMKSDGTIRDTEVSLKVASVHDHEILIAAVRGSAPDVSEGSDLRLRVINRIMESAASARAPDDFMEECLESTVSIPGFDCGCIYMVSDSGDEVVITHKYGNIELFPELVQSLDITEPGYREVFAEGEACYTEMPDGRSIAVQPLMGGGRVIGALCVAAGEGRAFLPSERETLRSAASEIGSAIFRLRISAELEEACTSANLYLDIMTHDITNATTVSLGCAELLTQMLEGDTQRIAKTMAESIQRSREIIRNVETIRSIHERPGELRSMPLDAVIRKELSFFSGAHIIYEGCSVSVMADDLIGEIFMNLIGNSIKFGGRDVEITVSVQEQGAEVVVCVEDTGMGVMDQMKALIFEQFRKESGDKGGKGLGLYIVRNLVESYGGRVWAEDRVPGHPGEGVSIRFSLRKVGSGRISQMADVKGSNL